MVEMRGTLVFTAILFLSSATLAGTVEGTVEVQEPAKIQRLRPASEKYGPQGLKSVTKPRPKVVESENVVVSVLDLITSPKGTSQARIRQVDKTFVPYVTAVRTGTQIEFPNGDKIFHSVYSESPVKPFHLPEYPQGEFRSVTFTKPGQVELFCAIHSHMNAHILVLPNEYFCKASAKGTFRLENIPAGKHKIRAWHPKLGSQVRLVEVPKEGSVKVSFALK